MCSVEQLKEIVKSLRDENVKRIVLTGEPGDRKTWMAKKISDRAIKEKLFDIALWVFMCKDYDNMSLCNSIAEQLCLVSTTEEWQVNDDDEETEEEDAEEENLENLKEKIHGALAGKKFLLILDDEGKIDEEKIRSVSKDILPLDHEKSYKVLITRASTFSRDTPKEARFEVKPLPMEESLSLLNEKIEGTPHQYPSIRTLVDAFVAKSNRFPSIIAMITKALSYFSQNKSGVGMLEKALEEASHDNEINHNVKRLLLSKYEAFPSSVLIDLCWGGSHFFRDRGCIHYNELITYWILEGYLGRFDSVKKVYEQGHHILMELMDCGVLKKQETGYVFMDGLDLKLDDLYPFF